MKTVTKKMAQTLAKRIIGKGAILVSQDDVKTTFQGGELLHLEIHRVAVPRSLSRFRYFRVGEGQAYRGDAICVQVVLGGYATVKSLYFAYDSLEEIMYEYAGEEK